jgi:hypothetical protein
VSLSCSAAVSLLRLSLETQANLLGRSFSFEREPMASPSLPKATCFAFLA